MPMTFLRLSRNFGQHNAVLTGLRAASGRYIATMDDDLQNPPEEVVKLYDHARLGGWDVVYTRYAVKHHASWRNLGSRFANAIADRLLDKPRGLYLSSFRCMSTLVVQAVSRYSGPYPYIDGLIMQVTQRIDSIEYVFLDTNDVYYSQFTLLGFFPAGRAGWHQWYESQKQAGPGGMDWPTTGEP